MKDHTDVDTGFTGGRTSDVGFSNPRIRGGNNIQDGSVDPVARAWCNLRRTDDMIKDFIEDVEGIHTFADVLGINL